MLNFNPDSAMPSLDGAPIDWKAQNRGLTPIFFAGPDGKEHYRIVIAGDTLTEASGLVDDGIKERFADAYDAWKSGVEGKRENDLTEWPALDDRQIAKLHAVNIYTINDVADLIDGNLHRVIGGRALREKAKQWLAGMPGSAKADDTENLRARVVELEAKLAELRPTKAASKLFQPKLVRRGRQSPSPETRARLAATTKAAWVRRKLLKTAEQPSAITEAQEPTAWPTVLPQG